MSVFQLHYLVDMNLFIALSIISYLSVAKVFWSNGHILFKGLQCLAITKVSYAFSIRCNQDRKSFFILSTIRAAGIGKEFLHEMSRFFSYIDFFLFNFSYSYCISKRFKIYLQNLICNSIQLWSINIGYTTLACFCLKVTRL